ncbi:MAG: DUF2177 family protein [Chitinophagaceae bacterium]|nr:DUF2177 family protein [Rubrivivax sp.]
MTKYAITYAATFVTMLALDLLWLGVIAKPIYQAGIGHLMAERFNVPVIVFFYVMFAAGLVVFGILPQAGTPGFAKAAAMAALFGFFCYATYDMTNLATLKGWPLGLSLADMAWGTLVSAVSAGVGKWVWDKVAA